MAPYRERGKAAEQIGGPSFGGIRDFGLERFFAKHEFAAKHILGASDVEGLSMAELLALADAECRGLWSELRLGYTESSGLPQLRSEIASLYDGLTADEVYRLIEHDPATTLPAAATLDPRAVSLGVMSKAFGLAGLRIGWIASRDKLLRDRVAALKDYTTICNSAPSEILALVALRARD